MSADRCESTNGAVRCCLRPHPVGDHVGLVDEGDPAARVETWARRPGDGPELVAWAEDARATGFRVRVESGVLLLDDEPEPEAGEAPSRRGVPPDGSGHPPAPREAPRAAHEAARDLGFTGDSCPTCGSLRVVRTGTCSTCRDCGSNAGCG